jgi:polar amino acid transport system substrate-binding protein
LLVSLFLFGAASASAQTLTINTADIFPLSTPGGTGYNDVIVKEAFRRMGIEARTVVEPSERSLVNADKGIDDGNMVRIAGLEAIYPNLVLAPEKISDFDFAAFTMKTSVEIAGWESLKPYNVGIVRGWKILEANIVGTKSLSKVKDPEVLFSLLTHDRADLVVFDRTQGLALLRSRRIEGVRALTPLLTKREMFLYLNRRHAALAPGFAATLREMKRDGTFQRIVDDVLANQWEKE